MTKKLLPGIVNSLDETVKKIERLFGEKQEGLKKLFVDMYNGFKKDGYDVGRFKEKYEKYCKQLEESRENFNKDFIEKCRENDLFEERDNPLMG